MKIKIILLLVGILFFASCSESTDGSSRLQVNLVDGPGDFEAVNIDIQEFHVNYNSDENSGWMTFEVINPGIYDILELTGGVELGLIDEELPSGTIQQIRLVLGENNTIVVDGEELELNTPSAQQSGLKLNIHEELQENTSYTMTLDFDVDKSIVQAGNSGNFNLKPTIRAIPIATTGSIIGTINPSDTQILVTIFDTTQTEVATSFADENGDFVISGLEEGTYSIRIEPAPNSGYNTVGTDAITVALGEVSDIGTIAID